MFIAENKFECDVRKLDVILFRPQCANSFASDVAIIGEV